MINPQECNLNEEETEEEFNFFNTKKDSVAIQEKTTTINQSHEKSKQTISELYEEMKDEWCLCEEDLFNHESMVQFNVYLDNMSETIEKLIGKKIDLKQNKDIKRLKMTITSQHHSYYDGSVKGYGKRVQKQGQTLHIISSGNGTEDDVTNWNKNNNNDVHSDEENVYLDVEMTGDFPNINNSLLSQQQTPVILVTKKRNNSYQGNSQNSINKSQFQAQSSKLPLSLQKQINSMQSSSYKHQLPRHASSFKNQSRMNPLSNKINRTIYQEENEDGEDDDGNQLQNESDQLQENYQHSKTEIADFDHGQHENVFKQEYNKKQNGYQNYLSIVKDKYKELESRISNLIHENRQYQNEIKVQQDTNKKIQTNYERSSIDDRRTRQQNQHQAQQIQQYGIFEENKSDNDGTTGFGINIKKQKNLNNSLTIIQNQRKQYQQKQQNQQKHQDLFFIENVDKSFHSAQQSKQSTKNISYINKRQQMFDEMKIIQRPKEGIQLPPNIHQSNNNKNEISISKLQRGYTKQQSYSESTKQMLDLQSVNEQINSFRQNNIGNGTFTGAELMHYNTDQMLNPHLNKYEVKKQLVLKRKVMQRTHLSENQRVKRNNKVFNRDDWLYKEIRDILDNKDEDMSYFQSYSNMGQQPQYNTYSENNYEQVFPPSTRQPRGISKEDIQTITDDHNVKDTNATEDKKLMEEWEKYMSDFVPEDINTVIMPPQSEQVFYEDVGGESVYIRGAYFVGTSTTNNKNVDLFILDPTNRVIFSKRRKEEGIFRFNTTIPGTYKFVFSNMKDRKSEKDVTVALNVGNKEKEKEDEHKQGSIPPELTEEQQALINETAETIDLESLERSLRGTDKEIKRLKTEQKFQKIRQNAYNNIVISSNTYNFYMAIIESIIFVVICFAQLYYLKNVLEHKRVI